MKLDLLVHLVVLTVLVGSYCAKGQPCEDSRCRTGSCNSNGACICDLPHPSTILDGDRPFLGGKYCDEEMTMCDGTNSFWCESGGKCVEIVQGENYTCKCPPGYGGDHCEHSGTPCGSLFCFHQAQCLSEAETCDCPPPWKGSANCLVPTITQNDSDINWTRSNFPEEKTSITTNWTAIGFAITFSAVAVAGGAIYAKKLFDKKEIAVAKFRRLSEMQTQSTLDENGDDEDGSTMILHDNSHR